MAQQNTIAGGPLNVVGKRGPNIDAVERVTGRAKYTGDIDLPGMLVARVLRSPRPTRASPASIPVRPRRFRASAP